MTWISDLSLLLQSVAAPDTIVVQTAVDAAQTNTWSLAWKALSVIASIGVAVLAFLRYRQDTTTPQDVFYEKRFEATEILIDRLVRMINALQVNYAPGMEEYRGADEEQALELYRGLVEVSFWGSMYLPDETGEHFQAFMDVVSSIEKSENPEEQLQTAANHVYSIIRIIRKEQGLGEIEEDIRGRWESFQHFRQ
jgi:hypothetical protein